jgi:hypothetical protein
MQKSERFGLVLSPAEKSALWHLAARERISAGAVLRRLVWNEAEKRGLLQGSRQEQEQAQREGGAVEVRR